MFETVDGKNHSNTQDNCSGGSRISRRGGVDHVGGRGPPRRLCFENFVCQNERIWTLGGRTPGNCQCRSANELHTFTEHNLLELTYMSGFTKLK